MSADPYPERTPAVDIDTQPDWDPDHPGEEPFERKLVVNRAGVGDANVVLSFWANGMGRGRRDAFGIPPTEAIKLAAAILNAVNSVNGAR